MHAGIGLILGVGLLSACNNPETSKTVFDDQLKALKKAEAVDAKIQKNTETLQQGVDAATDTPAAAR